jgi:hypothetical protein
MRFTVIWLPTADRAFIDLWIAAPDRPELTRAAETIDAVLSMDPQTKTTPIDRYYFLRIDPLLVLLDIDLDDRIVHVIEVRHVGQ